MTDLENGCNNNANINFFTCCSTRNEYEDFIIPFIFFARTSNPNSFVEIAVSDITAFNVKFEQELKELNNLCDNFLIRNMELKPNKNLPGTYRWLETPTVFCEYTYIVDVDIMFTHNVLDDYVSRFLPGLPYYNIIRPRKKQLSGLILVQTTDFYNSVFKKAQIDSYKANKPENDEMVLYRMCQQAHGLPPVDLTYRYVFGVHLSPNRGKQGKALQMTTTKITYDTFIEYTQKYPELFKLPSFKKILDTFNKEVTVG
jgi:hypothetical protein